MARFAARGPPPAPDPTMMYSKLSPGFSMRRSCSEGLKGFDQCAIILLTEPDSPSWARKKSVRKQFSSLGEADYIYKEGRGGAFPYVCDRECQQHAQASPLLPLLDRFGVRCSPYGVQTRGRDTEPFAA